MDVRDCRGKTAAVTGAGSGIGRATALALARRGARLAICDIDEQGLEKTTGLARALGVEVSASRVDVGNREQMHSWAEEVHRAAGAADILVNNAGVALGGGLLDTDLEDWDWIVPVNLWGVIYGCHFFVPPMVRRGRGGHVVNVSSTAGFVALESLLAYSVTKFAVFGLSEALRDELAPHGIGVTVVCPGVINTPITRKARIKGIGADPAMRGEMADAFRRRNYTPERAAENILKAVRRNRAVAPIAPEAWLGYYWKRFAPGLLARFKLALGRRMRARAGVTSRSGGTLR